MLCVIIVLPQLHFRGDFGVVYSTCCVLSLCSHSYIHNDLKVALIGPKVDLTYEYQVIKLITLAIHMVWFLPSPFLT